MIQQAATISLTIVALHVCTWDGMILHRPAEALGQLLDRIHLGVLRKPAYECVMCMGGIYTLIAYPLLFGWSWLILPTMLCVIGLNSLAAAALKYLQE